MAINKRPTDKKRTTSEDNTLSGTQLDDSLSSRLSDGKTSQEKLFEAVSDITRITDSGVDSVTEYDQIERLLSIIVRQQSDACYYEKIGSIRIFDVKKSPDTSVLRHDRSIKKVFTLYDLREALESPAVKMIMVPDSAAIARLAVSDICEYYLQAKTIFVETS